MDIVLCATVSFFLGFAVGLIVIVCSRIRRPQKKAYGFGKPAEFDIKKSVNAEIINSPMPSSVDGSSASSEFK